MFIFSAKTEDEPHLSLGTRCSDHKITEFLSWGVPKRCMWNNAPPVPQLFSVRNQFLLTESWDFSLCWLITEDDYLVAKTLTVATMESKRRSRESVAERQSRTVCSSGLHISQTLIHIIEFPLKRQMNDYLLPSETKPMMGILV